EPSMMRALRRVMSAAMAGIYRVERQGSGLRHVSTARLASDPPGIPQGHAWADLEDGTRVDAGADEDGRGYGGEHEHDCQSELPPGGLSQCDDTGHHDRRREREQRECRRGAAAGIALDDDDGGE